MIAGGKKQGLAFARVLVKAPLLVLTGKLMDNLSTRRWLKPLEILRQACQWGREAGLRYVYSGNLWGDDNESTRCPGCGEGVIERTGFRLGRVRVVGGRCEGCGEAIAGVGLP